LDQYKVEKCDVADRAMGGPVRPTCGPRVFWSYSRFFFLIEVFGAPLLGANECKEFGRSVGTQEMDVEQLVSLIGSNSSIAVFVRFWFLHFLSHSVICVLCL
jgi:hypothetical protein